MPASRLKSRGFTSRRPMPAEKELSREQRLAQRAQRAIEAGARMHTAVVARKEPVVLSLASASATQTIAPQPKSKPLRSEPYRRLVASLPCINCCVVGYSQAAHPPPTGKGIKEDDRLCFPLCCARPGVHGCHYLFDQHKLMPRDAMHEKAAMWGEQVRALITGFGNWPANLPAWEQI